MKTIYRIAILIGIMLMIACAQAEKQPEEQSPAEGKASGDYTYTVLENGTAEITGYSGEDENVVIPGTLDGYPVTAIGEQAFLNCSSLTSVTIPEGVTAIGNDAFFNCTGLTSIVIPDSVERIGNSAFCDCTGLTSVIIPAGVKSLGEFVFYLPESVKLTMADIH